MEAPHRQRQSGKAIQELKPDANAKAEAKKGQKQADDDLKEASS